MGFLPGGRLAIWYYFPGEALLWPGAMVFLPGEGLLYVIPSGGTFAIWYNFSGDNLPWYFIENSHVTPACSYPIVYIL